MSKRASGAGNEDGRRIDWQVYRDACAIAERMVRKDAARDGDIVADSYRHRLQDVSERLALRRSCRDEDGSVCEAMIWAYSNAGPRKDLARIRARGTGVAGRAGSRARGARR